MLYHSSTSLAPSLHFDDRQFSLFERALSLARVGGVAG